MSRHISSSTLSKQWDTDMLPSDQWPAGAISRESVKKLFARMHALYGAKFLDQWKDLDIPAVQRHWGIALGKMTSEQLRRGMALLETLDLPPTLPQFIKLCKPELDPQAAYFEAVAGIAAREQGEVGLWSDPAIYWATVAIGAFDLKTRPYAQIRRRWEAALTDARAHPHTEQIPLPDMKMPMPEEPELPQHSLDNTTESVAVEKIVQVAKSASVRPDHKRWAKRIEERIANGDKTVTKHQAKAAKEALR